MKKSKGECKSIYLISSYGPFIQLCSMILFIKIIFLFNEMISKINIHVKIDWINQMKKQYLAMLQLL
jgi:hypothetical protein